MAGLCWFFVGIGVSAVCLLTLRWTVAAMRPGKAGSALALVWGGGLLRSLAVGLLLFIAVRQMPRAGLLALVGFLGGRSTLIAIAARFQDSERFGHSKPIGRGTADARQTTHE